MLQAKRCLSISRSLILLHQLSKFACYWKFNGIEVHISSVAFTIGLPPLLGMQDKFEVTLEATHHGPHVDLPACFVEIGAPQTISSEYKSK